MVTSTAAEPGRGPGCSHACAVATSPTSPSRTAHMHREHRECRGATSPRVGKSHPWGQGRGLWKSIRSIVQLPGTVTAGGSPARVPDGSRSRGTRPL